MAAANDNFDCLVIANPRSAGGNVGRRWDRIAATIRANFGPFRHRFTTRPRDASHIAREAAADGSTEMVVALGGDGTASEVVDGLFDRGLPVNQDVVLGLLPFGTGGDLRRTAGVSDRLVRSAKQLRGRQTVKIDVGKLSFVDDDGTPGVRHFINIASFGLSGLVDRFVNQSSKRLGGRLSFASATLKAMRRFSPQQARLQLDDSPAVEVTLQTIAVANGQYFGGGMRIAPDAQLDDGLFDVVLVGPMSLADVILRGHRLYRGSHTQMPQVSVRRAQRIEAAPVNADETILLDVDGETPGRLPAQFELLPGVLNLKRPATAPA